MESGFVVDGNSGGTLDITLAGPGGTVSGTVRNSRNEPSGDSLVVLIPQGSSEFISVLPETFVTDQNGAYSFEGIRPGSYEVYAWESIEKGAYQNRIFLEPFKAQSRNVTVRESSIEEVNLPLILEN